MAGKPAVLVLDPVGRILVPASTVNGAVAELAVQPDGTITAEIRIPGPPVP
jgi:hypothetical protein